MLMSKARVVFKNGDTLEFEPPKGREEFAREELVKINNFAVKRSGVLFVHVEEDNRQHSTEMLHRRVQPSPMKKTHYSRKSSTTSQ